MTILLLGGNGLLGHNVLRQLLQQGHKVHVLVRNPHALYTSGFPECDTLLTVFKGSLLRDADLHAAAEGCEAIVNCAGVTDMSLLRYEEYLPVNRDVCGRLLQLMSQKGIAKAANRHPDWHIIIVNPGFMVGAYDTKPSSGQLLLTGCRKAVMPVPRGGKSFIHVADAAVAIVNALTMGRHGSRYLLTGQNLSLRQFYQLQARTLHYPQWQLPLPNWLLGVAGRCGDLLRLCGLRTQLSTRNVRQLMVREYYDNHRAVEELAMPQTPIGQAITDFHSWYRNKTIPPAQ